MKTNADQITCLPHARSHAPQATAEDRAMVRKFLAINPMAVLATNSRGGKAPESALVAFAELDSLEIIFLTFVCTRKYENLQSDNHVSLVIGWDTQEQTTVQYEGMAVPITDDAETYIQIFLAKDTPCTERFLRNPNTQLFKVTPTWIRYSQYANFGSQVIELSF